MAWNDDDFPDEDTNPSAAVPVVVPGPHTGTQQAVGTPAAPQQPYGQQQYAQRPPQPQYPQQQQPGGWPMTGQFSGVQQPQAQQPTQTGNPAPFQPPSPSALVPILRAPVVTDSAELAPPQEQASRVVYGLSGMAVGGMIGIMLGVFNCFAEGTTITAGSDFILQAGIWFAFLVGVLAFWKPDHFDGALDRIQARIKKD